MTIEIADAHVIYGSRVAEVVFGDGLRGAADLRDLVPDGTFEVVGDGAALRWPDGTEIPADRLLGLVLNPPLRRMPMTAREFAGWADDGSDVRWELHGGTPIPRPGATVGHSRTVTALLSALDGGDDRMALMNVWVGGGGDDLDLRTSDLAVLPRRRIGAEPPWVDDAVVAVEVSEAATAWIEPDRVRAFRRLPSVSEIAVVDARGAWARVERRDGGEWRSEEVALDGTLRLKSIGWSIPLADLMRDRVR